MNRSESKVKLWYRGLSEVERTGLVRIPVVFSIVFFTAGAVVNILLFIDIL